MVVETVRVAYVGKQTQILHAPPCLQSFSNSLAIADPVYYGYNLVLEYLREFPNTILQLHRGRVLLHTVGQLLAHSPPFAIVHFSLLHFCLSAIIHLRSPIKLADFWVFWTKSLKTSFSMALLASILRSSRCGTWLNKNS